ncbi:MAG: hypothetical protein Q9219_005737 [cf. Caloplaca sp. 3 TL-2023]
MEVLQPQAASLPTDQPSSRAFSGTEGVYMLPHHQQEIDRLQRQHRFMKGTTDGALLDIPLPSVRKQIQVLDSGCADACGAAHPKQWLTSSNPSGTWLLDLKIQHPDHDWKLHGVDIGSSLFPPVECGLDLRQHDIRQPFPSAWGWSNFFDVVHQRLLIWGLDESAWPVVLQNQHDILKPGGWIQIVEVEWIDPQRPHSLPELHKHSLMQQWSTSTFGMDIDIAYKIEGLLEKAGFVNVAKTQFDHGFGALAHKPEQKDGSAELYVECFRSIDTKMPPDGIPGVAKTPHEFHKFLDALEIEIKEHGYVPKLNLVRGQKAPAEMVAGA